MFRAKWPQAYLAWLLVGFTTAASATSLPPPSGYSTSLLIFEDNFISPTLDTTKWNPWLGDDRYGRWGDQGALPAPYSAMNCNSTCSNSYQIQYYDPYPYGYGMMTTTSHMLGGGAGNLALVARPSGYFGNLGYSWATAAVATYGKAYLPAGGGYVQWHAKMPDSRHGAWAALWLLSNGGAEMDIQESGYTWGSANVNATLASHWQGSGGSQIIQDTGRDLSAGYHTYGVEYRPGQSWKVFLDGSLMASWTSGVPTNAAYQLIVDFEIAGPNTSGWHSVADPVNYPGPFEFDIDDVQIYSLSGTTPPDTTAPSTPTGLAATLASQTEVDLTWAPSSDPDSGVFGYDVYRNGSYLAFSASPSYADRSVAANTTYTYQVLAYDAAHNASALSSPVTITTSTLIVGGPVVTMSSVNLRRSPGIGKVYCTEPGGALGTITGGPQNFNGVAWWQTAFGRCAGWAPQSSLEL